MPDCVRVSRDYRGLESPFWVHLLPSQESSMHHRAPSDQLVPNSTGTEVTIGTVSVGELIRDTFLERRSLGNILEALFYPKIFNTDHDW